MFTLAYSVGTLMATKQTIKYIFKPKNTLEHYKDSIPFQQLMQSAVVSRLAYEEPMKFHSKLQSLCHIPSTLDILSKVTPCSNDLTYIDASQICDSEDTQAYIWKTKDIIYLAFRGTEDKRDILADIDVRSHPISTKHKVKVHRGFYEQFEVVNPSINKYIDDVFMNDPEIKRIVITGHSLGGGLATIAAYIYAIKYPSLLVSCHTFGSPRVGNSEFVNDFDKVVKDNWRVYHYQDPVCMIPLSFRFNHLSNTGLCLGDDRKYNVTHGDLHWAIRPFVSLGCLDFPRVIDKHDCEMYVDKIEDLYYDLCSKLAQEAS